MTIFELVKLALDELYEEAKEEFGAQADAEIKNKMSYLSDNYNRLGQPSRQPVDYKDPATRFAYVYKYVAAHADYLVQVMESCKNSGVELFRIWRIRRVSCIGGGPGSDVVAILKYLDEHRKSKPVESVTCHLLDREQAWGDTWGEIARSLKLGIAVHDHSRRLMSPTQLRGNRRGGFCEPICSCSAFSCPKFSASTAMAL